MKLENFISTGFYINLDFRTDKNEHMKNLLKKLGLSDIVHRCPAVPAFTSGKTEYIINDDEKMLAASMACSKSHRNIIEHCKKNNYENVLIFEDDAYFYESPEYNGIDIVEKALDDLITIPDWQIFYLGTALHDPEIRLVSEHLVECREPGSTVAYILNKRSYDLILSCEEITHIDTFLCRTLTKKFTTYPFSVSQLGSGKSDLGGHDVLGLDFWKNKYKKPIHRVTNGL
jgi:GR25 family glycosyltransferase involved in LPS biosynthesis